MAYSQDVTYRRMKAKLQKDLKKVPSNLKNRRNHIKGQIKRLDDAFKARTRKLLAGGKSNAVSRRDRKPLAYQSGARKDKTDQVFKQASASHSARKKLSSSGTSPTTKKVPKLLPSRLRKLPGKLTKPLPVKKAAPKKAAPKKASAYAQGMKTAKADAAAARARASARRAAAERKRLGGLHRVPSRSKTPVSKARAAGNPWAKSPVPTRRKPAPTKPAKKAAPKKAAPKKAPKKKKTARKSVTKQLKKARKRTPNLQKKRDKDGKLTARGRYEKLVKRRGYINK